MSCARAHFYALLLAAFAALPLFAGDRSPATLQSVTVKSEDNGATIEVISSRALTPQVQTVENPLRLVIDLPGSNLGAVKKTIAFRNAQIKSIRLNQHQATPAVSRIVVDLATPVRCTWDSAGNKLRLRIGPDQTAAAKPPTAPAAAPETPPIAVPYAPGASGELVEAGSRVSNGSSITARDQTAVLRLTRGGEVRVCPGTTLSVATSSGGSDMMLGMNTGAIETHYHLDESSDSILTPDFRIVVPGPGEFNLAVKSDPTGDTCVSSLAGSNSSVVVAELLGNGTYEIKPEQQVLFRRGKMESIETPVSGCGCPPPQEPVMRTSADSSPVVREDRTGSNLALANSNSPDPVSAPQNIESASGNSAIPAPPAPADQSRTEDTKAQVSTPLVFNAKEFARVRAEAAPLVNAKVAALPLSTRRIDPLPSIVVLPPEHKGFFGKIGGFFRKMF